jgi:DNA-binding transcriptional MerR regulator
MYKIREFSRLGMVSPKALRLYDEMRLLSPARIDPITGYRYYDISQLPRLNRIIALKDLGFRLDQIGDILGKGLTVDQLRGMFLMKQAELQQQIADASERLTRVEVRLDQIEQEGHLPVYEVVLKKVQPLEVISLRGLVADPSAQWILWQELFHELEERNIHFTGPGISVYHDVMYGQQEWDIEVCVEIGDRFSGSDRFKKSILPAVERMACCVYHGKPEGIPQAYQALLGWIEANDYHITGPGRDVGWQTAPDTVIEAQFPVEPNISQ